METPNAKCYSCGAVGRIDSVLVPADVKCGNCGRPTVIHVDMYGITGSLGVGTGLESMNLGTSTLRNFGQMSAHILKPEPQMEVYGPITDLESSLAHYKNMAKREKQSNEELENENNELRREIHELKKKHDPKVRRLKDKDHYFPFDDYGPAWVE